MTTKQPERHGVLSLTEQETIINWNRGESEASLFTYDKLIQRHMEGKLGLKAIMSNSFGGKEYHFDKSRVRLPQPKKRISEETKRAMAARLKQGKVKQPALMQS